MVSKVKNIAADSFCAVWSEYVHPLINAYVAQNTETQKDSDLCMFGIGR